jgi:hypothetical protein
MLRSRRNLRLARRRKLKKALAEANKEHAQREQAVAERLHTMSTTAESKCFALSSVVDFCCTGVFVDTCLLLFFSIAQNLPGYLRRLCKQTMTLL